MTIEISNEHEFSTFTFDNVDVVALSEDGTIKLRLDDKECSEVEFTKDRYTGMIIYKED